MRAERAWEAAISSRDGKGDPAGTGDTEPQVNSQVSANPYTKENPMESISRRNLVGSAAVAAMPAFADEAAA